MRTIESQQIIPLSSVKPLKELLWYRAQCLAATRDALRGSSVRRERSPVTGHTLEAAGEIEGLRYVRCPASGSLFLAELPDRAAWARLLEEVSRYRHAPEAFHAGLAQSRADYVYAPKVEWIEDALRLQEITRPRILEAVTGPSDFSTLLEESGSFSELVTVEESVLSRQTVSHARDGSVHAAVLLESLDRAHDPEALLQGVAARLAEGGLVFVTALVSSGFDIAVLGLRNCYLYPPDRANCFSLDGLSTLLRRCGFALLEVSTPGALDVEIVRAHLEHEASLSISPFERQVVNAGRETQAAFQTFLQQQGLSSFARIVARKLP